MSTTTNGRVRSLIQATDVPNGIGTPVHDVHRGVSLVEREARVEIGHGQRDMRHARSIVSGDPVRTERSDEAQHASDQWARRFLCASPVHLLLLMQSTVEPVESDEENDSTGRQSRRRREPGQAPHRRPGVRVRQAIDAAFRKLAREVRIPGFRPGKAPRRLLEARLGSETHGEQALQDALPRVLRRRGQRARRRRHRAARDRDHRGPGRRRRRVRRGRRDPSAGEVASVTTSCASSCRSSAISDEDVDKQVDALRERFADLADSEFPLVDDAYATIDIAGTIDGEAVDGLTASDFFTESVPPWSSPSSTTSCAERSPARSSSSTRDAARAVRRARRQRAKFRVIVKEVKQKVLPELTDEWVTEASEFETVDELRADIRKRVETMQQLPGADGVARQGARRRGRPRADRSAADARRLRDRGAGSKISRTASRIRVRASSSTSR